MVIDRVVQQMADAQQNSLKHQAEEPTKLVQEQ